MHLARPAALAAVLALLGLAGCQGPLDRPGDISGGRIQDLRVRQVAELAVARLRVNAVSLLPRKRGIGPPPGRRRVDVNVTITEFNRAPVRTLDVVAFDLEQPGGRLGRPVRDPRAEPIPDTTLNLGERIYGDLVYDVRTTRHLVLRYAGNLLSRGGGEAFFRLGTVR